MNWTLIAIGATVLYVFILAGALALAHAAKLGDRQMQHAIRDRWGQ